MAITITTNMAAINSQRHLESSTNEMQKAYERLSSGMRINGAKDDAAGLAINEGLKSEIMGLAVANRNANDAVSAAQTAEGGLDGISKHLQRIRELALQSSNGINTAGDRAKLQTEVAERIAEMDRVANTLTFNGKKLLDGSFGTQGAQVGTQKGDFVNFTLNSARTDDLGATSTAQTGSYQLAKATSSANSLQTSGTLESLTSGQLSINGTAIRAADSGDDTLSTSDQAASAIARAAAVNASADETGVRAVANATTVDLGTFTVGTLDLTSGDLNINGVEIIGASNSADAMAATINSFSASTGVVASNNAGDITLTAVDGRNIQLETDGAPTDTATFANFDMASGALDQTVSGTVTLYSNDAIVVDGTKPTNLGTGFDAQTFAATSARNLQDTNGDNTFEDLATGDLIINGFSVQMDAIANTDANERSLTDGAASAQNIALQINNTSGLKDQVVADAHTEMNLGKVSAAAADSSFDLVINGTTVTIDQAILENDSNNNLTSEINAALNSGSATDDVNGIVASINSDGELLLTADDGRNITVQVSQTNDTNFLANMDMTQTLNKTAKGSVSLSAKEGFSLDSIGGDKQALAGVSSDTGTVSKIDVSTVEGAQAALDTIDAALEQILENRAGIGAGVNRLEAAREVNAQTNENQQAASSRIADTDYAVETVKLTAETVKQTTAAAMLQKASSGVQQLVQTLTR